MKRQTPLTCSGHTRPVVDLAFSAPTADGVFLISACKDSNAMLRDGVTGDWIGTFTGHKGAVWSARLNRDATVAVTGAADFTAKLWSSISGDQLAELKHNHIVRAVDFSPDTQKLALTVKSELFIYDVNYLTSPAAPAPLDDGLSGPIKHLLWTPDGQSIVTGTDAKTIRVWDIRTGKVSHTGTVAGSVTSLELSPDGSTLTVADGTKEVTMWSTSTFEKITTITCQSEVSSASVHPTEKKMVVGGSDMHLHVYNIAGPVAESEMYRGHHGPVHCVRYSPDGELYASGSEDGTVRLWQTTVGKEYGLWTATSS